MSNQFKFMWLNVVVISCCILWACSTDDSPEESKTYNERDVIELTAETRAVSNELREFYLNFTTDMAKYADSTPGFESENIVVSPLSVAMLFAMTANGVDDETAKAYTDYLGVSDLNSLNELCATLINELPKVDTSATFKLANSIWVNKGMNLSLDNDFSSIVSRYYKAETRNEDFAKNNGKTLDKINGWCYDKTNGLIPRILEKLYSDNYAVLLNALYFKASWEDNLFDKSMTTTATFHGEKCDSKVEMMESSYYDGYVYEDDNFEYLFMSFGNEAYQLRIVIPKGNVTLQESASMLTPERYDTLIQGSYRKEVKVFLPKFVVKNKYSLNDMLKTTRESNLTNGIPIKMFDKDVNGSLLYSHATSLSIDETGAEAAAVTSEEISNTCLGREDNGAVIVKVDSPFYFFITEWSTGACILSGRIANL